ncbi:hypothetical protein E8E14_009193 [Neopestalotiopsis sp. 37M]|nr:hypothetical protein E8E14_009193 [Neopestalotiopsis sp. 37M]
MAVPDLQKNGVLTPAERASSSASEKETGSRLPAPAALPAGGPPPPPNGGTRAWLQVLGAFFLNINTWGLLNTFGIFQAEYSTGFLSSSSESAISWIGSLQAFLMLIGGVLCGRALDAGYFYSDVTIGVLLEVLGMMLTSISSQYWHVILAQGVMVGIGAAMAFMPSVAIVGTYFSTRRSLAMGVSACGSSVGGIIYPIVLKRLIDQIGFRWAVRVMAFIMLGTLSVSVAVMKPRLPPRKSGPLINTKELGNKIFLGWLAAVFFTLIGLYVPFFYVEAYALSIGVAPNLASYMIIIMNAASIPGRLFPGAIADKTGTLAIMVPSVLLSGVIMLAWIKVKTQGALIAVAVLFGFFSGSIQAVLPATVPFLLPDLSMIGTNLGMTLSFAGLGLLVGTPVAGAILDHQSTTTHQDFSGALAFSGACVILGSVLLAVVRTMKVGFKLTKG